MAQFTFAGDAPTENPVVRRLSRACFYSSHGYTVVDAMGRFILCTGHIQQNIVFRPVLFQ